MQGLAKKLQMQTKAARNTHTAKDCNIWKVADAFKKGKNNEEWGQMSSRQKQRSQECPLNGAVSVRLAKSRVKKEKKQKHKN